MSLYLLSLLMRDILLKQKLATNKIQIIIKSYKIKNAWHYNRYIEYSSKKETDPSPKISKLSKIIEKK